MSTADFTLVVRALDEYTSVSGRPTLALGGWESEDPAIVPPHSLVESLSLISARLHSYTYIRELHAARSSAAGVFANLVRMDGELPTPEHIAILPNSTQALLLTLAALKMQGIEHVVIAAPSYFAAAEACHYLGLTRTIVPAADFVTGALDSEAIVAAMSRRRSALLLTNPAYSIGVEYGWPCLRALFAELPPESFVVLDETRLGLNWNDEAPWYSADYPQQILVIRSPSKIFFINGQKTSIILGMPRLIHAIERVSEALLGSVSGVAEPVALAYLNCWQQWVDELRADEMGPLRRWRRQIITTFRRNRRTVAWHLKRRGFTLSPVGSGPYLLACIERGDTDRLDSYAVARDVGVLMMDSSFFFHEHNCWLGFRVNLSSHHRHISEAISRVFPLETPPEP
ncbi:MAG: aminotransferase class I/II-fold pyridoxal phosphate-dependent enzyme [Ktedonobacterales bacterium]